MYSYGRHVEPASPVPQCWRKDTHGCLACSQIELTRPGETVPDQGPLHKIGRVIDRDTGVVFKSRRGEKVVVVDSNDRGIGVEPTDHGITKLSRLGSCRDTVRRIEFFQHVAVVVDGVLVLDILTSQYVYRSGATSLTAGKTNYRRATKAMIS